MDNQSFLGRRFLGFGTACSLKKANKKKTQNVFILNILAQNPNTLYICPKVLKRQVF
jgi:hypothetical protein